VSSGLDLDTVDRLLTTTRSVRKRLDVTRPVGRDVIEECLRIALQAPNGSDMQRWRWIVVTDPGKRRALGDMYVRAFEGYFKMAAGQEAGAIHSGAGSDAARKLGEGLVKQQRLMDSVRHLMDHIHEVPVHVVPCVVGRIQMDASAAWISSHFGSVYPASWNFALALRSRGLGTCVTTAHLGEEEAAAEILGIPYERMTQVGLLPVAYYTGETFKTAKRRPMDEVVHWETFDAASLAEGGF
jgi:nitroreductase